MMTEEIMDEEKTVINEEEICRRCGRCCHRKEISKGKVVFLPETCPNLEKDEHERGKYSCKIYEKRFTVPLFFEDGKPFYCLPARIAYEQVLLPSDCPYVAYYRDGGNKALKNFLVFQKACETQNWDGIFPKPKSNCKHCYGRGYVGRDVNKNTYVPCGCGH